MYKGKATCKILKDIRKKIADENDIAFVTSECKYQGDCTGTCPKCEAELRYLEEELRKRKQMGKTAIVAGLSFGLATTVASCGFTDSPVMGDVDHQYVENQTAACSNQNTPPDTSNTDFPTPPIKNPLAGEIIEQPTGKMPADIIYTASEINNDSGKLAQFPGGLDSLNAYLYREIKYPENARNNGIHGTVLIEFVVEKDGRVTHVKVKVPLFPECDAEAVRVIEAMPDWKPAEIHGEAERMFYQIPITFSLK